MTKDGVIADTSVMIAFLRGTKPVSLEVEKLLRDSRLKTTGIIITELMQGIRDEKEEDSILGLIDALEILEISTDIWIRAGKISSFLRRKGINLSITDIAISALAIEHNLSIFTLDEHFEKIPDIKLYKS
jgi:hypothetical protein